MRVYDYPILFLATAYLHHVRVLEGKPVDKGTPQFDCELSRES